MFVQDLYKEGTVFRYLLDQGLDVAVTFDTDAFSIKVRVTGMDMDETTEKSLESDSDVGQMIDFAETVEELLTVLLVNLGTKQKNIAKQLKGAKSFLTKEKLTALEDKGWGYLIPN